MTEQRVIDKRPCLVAQQRNVKAAQSGQEMESAEIVVGSDGEQGVFAGMGICIRGCQGGERRVVEDNGVVTNCVKVKK